MGTLHRASARARGSDARASRLRERGQSVPEFALILTPLMLLLMGILQMGLVLNAYVTLSNASREGARAASIYVYDRGQTKAQNDTARAQAARDALTASMGLLHRTSPNLGANDITISYATPTGIGETDTRAGQQVTVRATYHLDLFVPLIANLLPRDAGGRMPLDAQVTMVVN